MARTVGSGTFDEPLTRGDTDPIVIGFVNNMPDAAIRTTERQFRAVLSATSLGRRVSIRPFFLPEIARADVALSYLRQHYEPINALWTSQLDGLIVTGTDPRATALTQEPYWANLQKLVDWAEDHTASTVWSCLAAHAAVLHMDGIERHAPGGKLSGIFACRKIADHRILAGVRSHWRVPHSRYNGLPEAWLRSAGYVVLSTSVQAGVDLFVKQRRSLFVFLQGHPEYDPEALLREHRRDVIRFLSGEKDQYPESPVDYFDNDTKTALAAFRQRAFQHRGIDLLADLPTQKMLPHSWHKPATRIFANWLDYLLEQKIPCEPRTYDTATMPVDQDGIPGRQIRHPAGTATGS